MASPPRIPPLTPEQSAAWQARKTAQWERILAAFVTEPPPPPEPVDPAVKPPPSNLPKEQRFKPGIPQTPPIMVELVQTRDTFVVRASGADGFSDEFVLGQPAHTVTRDDKLFNVPARDLNDAQVDNIIAAWKAGRKLLPAFDPMHGKGEPPSRQ